MATDPRRPNVQCSAVRYGGERCKKAAIRGGTVCSVHGGQAPQVRAKAAIRLAVSQWSDGKQTADPSTTLLRLMTVAYERAEQHATALDGILEREGWESAFVGDAYTESGQKTGEYARQLAKWEAAERAHAADLSVKAISANLEARRVRATEAQVAMVLDAMRRSLDEAGLGEKTGEVIGGVGRHLRVAAG